MCHLPRRVEEIVEGLTESVAVRGEGRDSFSPQGVNIPHYFRVQYSDNSGWWIQPTDDGESSPDPCTCSMEYSPAQIRSWPIQGSSNNKIRLCYLKELDK